MLPPDVCTDHVVLVYIKSHNCNEESVFSHRQEKFTTQWWKHPKAVGPFLFFFGLRSVLISHTLFSLLPFSLQLVPL